MPQVKAAPKAEWTTAAIGIAAGQVWQYLSSNGKASVAEVEQAADSKTMAWAGIGWLAREGKLAFGQDGRTTKVWLI